jgi:hypothetical protein
VKLKFSFICYSISCFLLIAAPPVQAELLLTEKAALDRAFPGLRPVRRTLYLTKEEVAAVQAAARSKLPSPVVTVFEAPAGEGEDLRAILDTHIVRTMPETVMTVASSAGLLKMALVLQFGEPPDYLPREKWLRTMEGMELKDEFWPGRGIRRVTGSTLTVQALTEAVRRSLAVNAIVLGGKP